MAIPKERKGKEQEELSWKVTNTQQRKVKPISFMAGIQGM